MDVPAPSPCSERHDRVPGVRHDGSGPTEQTPAHCQSFGHALRSRGRPSPPRQEHASLAFRTDICKGLFTHERPTGRGVPNVTHGLFCAGSYGISERYGVASEGNVPGLFTSRVIEAGEVVAAYTGIVVTTRLYNELWISHAIQSYIHQVDLRGMHVYVIPLNGLDATSAHPDTCVAGWCNEAPEGVDNNMRMRIARFWVSPTSAYEGFYAYQCQLVAPERIEAGSELYWYYGKPFPRRWLDDAPRHISKYGNSTGPVLDHKYLDASVLSPWAQSAALPSSVTDTTSFIVTSDAPESRGFGAIDTIEALHARVGKGLSVHFKCLKEDSPDHPDQSWSQA